MKPKVIGTHVSCGLLILSLTLLGCSQQKAPADSQASALAETYTRTEVVASAPEAQKLLEDGNRRFTTGQLLSKDISEKRRSDLKRKGQHPIAVIVSCSDSRVPPELVFDQGLGDLFEIRVAGNVIDSVGRESVEYALEHLQTPLIVVLGHEGCGAVTSTVQTGEITEQSGSIMQKIKPSLQKAKSSGLLGDQLIEKTSDLNINQSIQELKKDPKVRELLSQGKLAIRGAKYQLQTGTVDWLL